MATIFRSGCVVPARCATISVRRRISAGAGIASPAWLIGEPGLTEADSLGRRGDRAASALPEVQLRPRPSSSTRARDAGWFDSSTARKLGWVTGRRLGDAERDLFRKIKLSPSGHDLGVAAAHRVVARAAREHPGEGTSSSMKPR
jgi:hypothetical protein